MAERLSTGHANAILTAWATLYTNGVMEIYTGTPPATADLTEVGSGTLLAIISNNGGTFVGGSPTNGLNFGTPVAGVLDKAPAEVWTDDAMADGIMGWFRFYDNTYTKGASTTAKRFDGRISTVAGDNVELWFTNTTVLTGAPILVNTLPITQPMV